MEREQSARTRPQSLQAALAAIVTLQCACGLLYVFLVPLWMPSDERAHMSYVLDLAATGHLHVMQVGDPSYETHQPPLFYALAALLVRILGGLSLSGQGYALRIVCLAFFALTTVLLHRILLRHIPGKRDLHLATLLLFALSPALLAICATVSNDSLSFLLAVLAAWILSEHHFHITQLKPALWLGVVTGLGMLCKLTQFPVLLVIAYCILRQSAPHPQQRLRLVIVTLMPMILMLIPWLLWNHAMYGSWTAMHRLYGAGAAYAEHPLPVRHFGDLNAAGIFTYHFLPTEFWLNQFHTPLWLKATLFGLVGAAVIGLSLWGRAARRESVGLLGFCAIFYAVHFATFLALEIGFSRGPVRWIFGGYFAFSFLLCVGLYALMERLATKRFTLPTTTLVACWCILTNCYLLLAQAPRLQSYGLHP